LASIDGSIPVARISTGGLKKRRKNSLADQSGKLRMILFHKGGGNVVDFDLIPAAEA